MKCRDLISSTVRIALIAAYLALSGVAFAADAPATLTTIVQGEDLAEVRAAVQSVGGEVTHELRVIKAVGARLTESQRQRLELHKAVTRIHVDQSVQAGPTPGVLVGDP